MSEKNKKILLVSGIVLALIILVCIVFCNIGIEKIDEGNSNEIVITPEEEISDAQFRETTIQLYFVNENNEIVPEIKKVDSKILLDDPYSTVMEFLIEGPQSEKLKTEIPEGTKLNEIKREGDALIIDFSKEFVDNQSNDTLVHGRVINQIVYTMTQFSEINKIRISIDGNRDVTFKNGNINFNQEFTREY